MSNPPPYRPPLVDPSPACGASQRLPITATPRERAIAELLAEDLTAGAVASRLGMQTSTVRCHIKHLAAKLPGRLPAIARIVVWWRGGSRELLG